jgi:hypothetical protein
MLEVTEKPLTEEQIEVLGIFRVPLFINYATGQRFIAERYWRSINPALKEALLRVLDSHE